MRLMKTAATVAVLAMTLAGSAHAFTPGEWTAPLRILVNQGYAPSLPVVNVQTPNYPGPVPFPNAAHTVDVSGFVPENAKAIRLNGMFRISHGSASEIAQVEIKFRKDASSPWLPYRQYTLEASTGNGVGTTFGTWVPLTDAKTFQYQWTSTNPWWMHGTHSSYAINLHLEAIGVPAP